MSRYRTFAAGEGQRFLDAIAKARGYPRCMCPEHEPRAQHTGGHGAPCTCTAATGPGVDLACPHVCTAHSSLYVAADKTEAVKVRGLEDVEGERPTVDAVAVTITAAGAVEELPAGYEPKTIAAVEVVK